MMSKFSGSPGHTQKLVPEDFTETSLDGHSLDELTEYLEAGRNPVDPDIEGSPKCREALGVLARLRQLAPLLAAADLAVQSASVEGWMQRVIAAVASRTRGGLWIPVTSAATRAELGDAEWRLRSAVRAAGLAVGGVTVLRCRLRSHDPVIAEVEVSVARGGGISERLMLLREEVSRRLSASWPLSLSGLDVIVRDVA